MIRKLLAILALLIPTATFAPNIEYEYSTWDTVFIDANWFPQDTSKSLGGLNDPWKVHIRHFWYNGRLDTVPYCDTAQYALSAAGGTADTANYADSAGYADTSGYATFADSTGAIAKVHLTGKLNDYYVQQWGVGNDTTYWSIYSDTANIAKDLQATTPVVSADEIAPNIVSSVDGVVNDGGDVDLIAGTNISITPSDALNQITIANTNDADITGVTAGSGLTGGGTSGTVTLNVNTDNGLYVANDSVQLTSAYFVGSAYDSRFVNEGQANSVTSSMIVDDTISTADIADGTIMNADINASAAIAGTKINPDFGSQNIATTGSLDVLISGSASAGGKIDVMGNVIMYNQDANGVTKTRNSPSLYLRGKYWQGAASNDYNGQIYLQVQDTLPTARMVWLMGGAERMYLTNTGKLMVDSIASKSDGMISGYIYKSYAAYNLFTGGETPHSAGPGLNQIPISDSTLMAHLNAGMLNGKSAGFYANDTTPPDVPDIHSFTATLDTLGGDNPSLFVKLEAYWTPETDASGTVEYEYNHGSSKDLLVYLEELYGDWGIETTEDTTFREHINTEWGNWVYLHIRSKDHWGNKSAWTAFDSVQVPNKSTLLAPDSLKCYQDSAMYHGVWIKLFEPANQSLLLKEYEYQVKATGDTAFFTFKQSKETFIYYLGKALQYTFRARAWDALGDSSAFVSKVFTIKPSIGLDDMFDSIAVKIDSSFAVRHLRNTDDTLVNFAGTPVIYDGKAQGQFKIQAGGLYRSLNDYFMDLGAGVVAVKDSKVAKLKDITATATNIDDAVSKKHTQNTDWDLLLSEGGALAIDNGVVQAGLKVKSGATIRDLNDFFEVDGTLKVDGAKVHIASLSELETGVGANIMDSSEVYSGFGQREFVSNAKTSEGISLTDLLSNAYVQVFCEPDNVGISATSGSWTEEECRYVYFRNSLIQFLSYCSMKANAGDTTYAYIKIIGPGGTFYSDTVSTTSTSPITKSWEVDLTNPGSGWGSVQMYMKDSGGGSPNATVLGWAATLKWEAD